MEDGNSYSGDEYSEEDEEGEELDPRIQDELEKLNVAANSINHLEAELDEARAVFRQTMTAATYHLNAQMKKLGNKNIEKARPFYDVLRELRKAHFKLQKATLQYEKANSRHVYARQRVHDAENRVFSSGGKRAFDTALQEMLNQATIEVNEAENQKKESWMTHQVMYKSYQEIEIKAKEMQNKLKKSVEKVKPYFVQKVGFDRHLWQLKLRVDSIQKGLSEAKLIYSNCLRSLETISDDIHQKRKTKKMKAMIASLQEREAGVGADSEDEMSLDQSQLDLDLDCNASLSEVQGILPDDVPESSHLSGDRGGNKLPSVTKKPSVCAKDIATEMENLSLDSGSTNTVNRQISGAESSDSDFPSGSFKREVYGCEQDENAAECSGEDIKKKERKKDEVVRNFTSDGLPLGKSESKCEAKNSSDLSSALSSNVLGKESVAKERLTTCDESLSVSQSVVTGSPKQLDDIDVGDGGDTSMDTGSDTMKVGEDVEKHCIDSCDDSVAQNALNPGDDSREKLEIAVKEFTDAVTVHKTHEIDYSAVTESTRTQQFIGSNDNANDNDQQISQLQNSSAQNNFQDITMSTETEALDWI